MIEQIVQTWGYAAVFAGTFLEGETVLVAAGFAAHRSMLDIAMVPISRPRRARRDSLGDPHR